MTKAGSTMRIADSLFSADTLEDGTVLVKVAGCGVCHTDLGFFYDGVRTRHELPLCLGHEISGRVVAAAGNMSALIGKAVVVPAVIPCGDCEPCRAGRGAICATQFFPGNDDHGGFASHVVVPGKGLCVVDEDLLAGSSVDLATLSVIADAVTTPYQAILNAGLKSRDLAIFIGIGGVGSFGVQLAAAMGAHVVAIDVDAERLEGIRNFGAEHTLLSGEDIRATKMEVRSWAKERQYPTTGWKIFETSGHPGGQALAVALLGYDAHLAVVGYTREKIEMRLSNLMAFDATMRGTWGCLPEYYPKVVGHVLVGDVELEDFVEKRPMSELNEVFEELHVHRLKKRPVMIPDFS
jgi:6-hydroxycyclohex-1-ene-1-carbonyl-CoA dehydrogenase|tara:strand:+ start:7200 stop:8252 length:1053 start_codon:yes stop_codon:yes gene_type:complete